MKETFKPSAFHCRCVRDLKKVTLDYAVNLIKSIHKLKKVSWALLHLRS